MADHFRFLAIQLFQGGGVGSNYSKVYRDRGGAVQSKVEVAITCNSDHADFAGVKASSDGLWVDPENANDEEWTEYEWYLVEDTREGWVEVWTDIIRAYHTDGARFMIDLTHVRPHGAPLKSFGGKASGPAPLAGSIVSIQRILETYEPGQMLTAIDSMVIDHHIAASIVAGGTRRSARMSQLNWDDPEVFDFITHKRNDPSVSWSTNISVVLDENFQCALDAGDAHADEVLHAIAEGMAADGEPGIYNLALAKVGEKRDVGATNPCGEAILEEHYDPETGTGSSSGESCNLGSVDLDAIGTDEVEAALAFDLMSRFLYRATLAPIYDDDQAEIEYRNRRLGVGVMGLQGWCVAHGSKLTDLPENEKLQTRLTRYRQIVRIAADRLADDLDLPRPIKVTAVAPTGTIAQLRGTTSGMHPVYARYFIRRVQYADTTPSLIEMMEKGYHIEDSVYAAHTKVVSIPVQDIIMKRHEANFQLIEQSDEVNVDQFLAIQGTLQSTFCGGTDGQAISATAMIMPGSDPERLQETLKEHLHTIKGATVFPATSRPQQPITTISREEYLEHMINLLVPADAAAVGDSNDGECVGGACPIR
jgi:ribonucleoside-triphosphate reductase